MLHSCFPMYGKVEISFDHALDNFIHQFVLWQLKHSLTLRRALRPEIVPVPFIMVARPAAFCSSLKSTIEDNG